MQGANVAKNPRTLLRDNVFRNNMTVIVNTVNVENLPGDVYSASCDLHGDPCCPVSK
jgi:hypothetical protein